jgi:hypothetical protein
MVNRRELFGGFGNSLFQYAYLYAQYRNGEIPDLYIQDEKYFEPYKEEIRSLYGANIEPIDMVSLHVRRGDYIGNSFYTDLTQTTYYEDAMAEFPSDTKFLVFCADRQPKSDDKTDMEWVKERFKGNQFQFFQGKDEVEDFNAQAGCKGHITANSSFSWWSAYVGGGKIVTPKANTWFSDGIERISIPDTWIQL